MNARSGFTLTELLITMISGSALMILAVGLVHQSMHLTSAARSGADEHRAMSRLASRFREDVRMADFVRVEADNSVRISIPQRGEVTYVAELTACIRTASDTATGADNSRVSREKFTLQSGGLVRFEMLAQPRRAALIIYRGGTATMHGIDGQAARDLSIPSRAETLRVEAVIGAVASLLGSQPQE